VLAAEAPHGGGRAARLGWFLAVALAAAAVSFAGIGSHSLWTPDEPRDAAVGKTMWRGGDLVVPRLNGRPFLEKPPLAWWAQTAAYRLLGASDATARVPSAVFATLTLLVAFALGKRLGGTRAGWLAAGALAGTLEYAEDMRRAIVDPPMVLAVALTYLGFVLLLGDAETGDPAGQQRLRGRPWLRYRGHLIIVLAVPLAFLAKGVVGLGLALEPPLVYLLGAAVLADWRARRGRAAAGRAVPATPGAPGRVGSGANENNGGALRATVRLLAPLALAGVPLFAALVLPWALALLREGGWPMVRECLINNTVGRLLATDAGRVYGHRQPLWYYVSAGAPALLPWTLALPAVLRSCFNEGAGGGARENPGGNGVVVGPALDVGARRLLLASFFLGAALLSVAASKRTVYLVPLLPALAVPIGLWLDRLGIDPPATPGRGRLDRATALLLLGVAAALPVLLWTAVALVALPATAALPSLLATEALPLDPLRATFTHGRVAVAGALALAAAALLLTRFVRHLRTGSTPTAPWLVVPFLALVLVYQTAVKAAIDPLKNLHDLTAAVSRLDPGRGAVAAYRPSETTEGIMGFDLDRRVEPLDTPAALAAFIARQPQGRVVLPLSSFHGLPPDLRGSLCLLYDESAAKASPYVIAAACAGAASAPSPSSRPSR
jgi:4-amino-4-deoxy-L-arabinose transferase-like glycosyltransferase